MEIKNVKLLFIGAGPANIFAALELIAKGYHPDDIFIIEQGNSSFKRKCKSLPGEGCKKCKYCDVVYGFGGAGMFSDGKLEVKRNQKFDSSSAEKVFDHMRNHGLKLISPKEQKIVLDKLKAVDIILKSVGLNIQTDFVSQHMGTENILAMTQSIERYLSDKKVNLLFNEEVVQVSFDLNRKTYLVETVNHEKKHCLYCSPILVVGMGKSAHHKFEHIFKSMNFNGVEKPAIVGIRYEFSTDTLLSLSENILKDPLISLKTELGDELTCYCTCHNGNVIYYYTGEVLLLGGHSKLESDSKVSNFGMAFIANSQKLLKSREYAYSYARLVATVGQNKPVIQTYGDFINNTEKDKNKKHRTSLPSYSYGNLNYLLPKAIAEALRNYIERLAKVDKRFADKDNILSAPVIEFVSPQFDLTKNFESMYKNIFFSGETSGKAYGIVTAAASGITIADAIIEKNERTKDENTDY